MDENLSKWLKGEISNEELKERIGSEEALKYIQIVGEVDNWVPDHTEHLFDPKEITSKPKAKVTTMRPWLSYAAAAVILIAVVSYLWLIMGDSTVSYSTVAGEVQEVELPDGSKATLAPNSEISWDKNTWKEVLAEKASLKSKKSAKRQIKLKGKVLLAVKKGSPFSVESVNGVVEVLGTVFEVDDFESGFNVRCFEGKVRATAVDQSSVIVAGGEGYLFFEGKWEDKIELDETSPDWLQNQTKFGNAPLTQVIKTLEKLYGITVEKGSVNTSRRFTGRIPNDKLDVALRTVFSPFKINYAQEGKKVILSEGN
ncbi:FecR family protein [Ekhidna lutea]|uniref:FecR family protein n=1 Tax=Ekhidna lutea TaxID=447679 RepID=A0A239FKJ2_EKHLU|nr:FecR domain-containing protein [Ekhidna lutea]SNS57365.1 FecR family protein [Ekhidna lutea]